VRAFIDTSSLFKKYVEETGSAKMEAVLKELSEITVSPVTWVEFNAVIARRLREKSLSREQSVWLRSQAHKDFQSFHRVIWNEALEKKAAELVYQFSLLTLDAIQLASGILSKADIFVTSDRRLFEEANKIMRKTLFI